MFQKRREDDEYRHRGERPDENGNLRLQVVEILSERDTSNAEDETCEKNEHVSRMKFHSSIKSLHRHNEHSCCNRYSGNGVVHCPLLSEYENGEDDEKHHFRIAKESRIDCSCGLQSREPEQWRSSST